MTNDVLLKSRAPGTFQADPDAAPVFRDHLRALDGLRGVAILMVFWAHSRPLEHFVATTFGFRFGFGYLGVELFFVLSGFLITRILLADRAAGTPLRYFMARRFLRIFPIYYLTILVAWLFWRDVLTVPAALYVTNYYEVIHPPATTVLGHTWSLAIEEHFYLLWPLAVAFAPRETARRVAQYGLPIVAVLTAVAVVAMNFADRTVTIGLINQGTLCRMLSLGLGAALAFHEPRIRQLPWRGLALAGVVAVVGAGLSQFPIRPATERFVPLAKFIGFAMLATASIAALIRLRDARAFPLAVLRSAPLRYVGRISYGLYLYHALVFDAFDCGPASFHTPIWKNVLAIAVSFAVAAASFHLIETPILRLKKRFSRPPAAEQMPDPAPAAPTPAPA